MASKRRRQTGSSQQGAGEGQMPSWGNRDLSTFDYGWQPRMYLNKMKDIAHPRDTFLCERHTNLEDFRGFGLVEGFERLGWLGALTVNSEGESIIYPDEILEWMSTLRREEGDNPPWTTTLTGVVHDEFVQLNHGVLQTIIPVDALPPTRYHKVSDRYVKGELVRPEDFSNMIQVVFEVPPGLAPGQVVLDMENLQPLARLIYKIFGWNVVPRTSDRKKVRTFDLPPMLAILTGDVIFPFYQLIVANIWDSHERAQKRIIPHCRVITRLLQNSGAIRRTSRPITIPAKLFNRASLNKVDFRFRMTDTHYVLHDDVCRRVQMFQKPEEGQEEEEEEREYEHQGAAEGIRAYPHRPASYQNWDEFQKTMFDRQEYHWEQQHLVNEQQQKAHEEQRQFNQHMDHRVSRLEQTVDTMAYYQQRYHHDYYEFAERSRHHHDYASGLSYNPHAEARDYSTLPPFEWKNPDARPLAMPGMEQPHWWQGGQQRHDPSGEASSSALRDPDELFDMRPLAKSLYEDFFGPSGSQ